MSPMESLFVDSIISSDTVTPDMGALSNDLYPTNEKPPPNLLYVDRTHPVAKTSPRSLSGCVISEFS